MRRLLSILLIMVGLNTAHAQSTVEADLTLEFASSYVWRGLHMGSSALQPELSLGWKGLAFLRCLRCRVLSIFHLHFVYVNMKRTSFMFVTAVLT